MEIIYVLGWVIVPAWVGIKVAKFIFGKLSTLQTLKDKPDINLVIAILVFLIVAVGLGLFSFWFLLFPGW